MTTLDIDIVRGYTTDCWYKKLLEFTFGSKISVLGDNYHFKILRDNDAFLMENFITAGYRDIKLRESNIIWMHLEAILIADISTADWRQISSKAWHVQSGNGLCDGFQCQWPSKELLIPDSWKRLWQKELLRSICPVYTSAG